MWVNVSTDQKNMRCLLKLLHSPHIFTFHQTIFTSRWIENTCQPYQIGIPQSATPTGVQTGKLLQVLCLDHGFPTTIPTTQTSLPGPLNEQKKATGKVGGWETFSLPFGKPKKERVWNVMLVSGRVFLGLCLPSNCKSINKTSCFFLSPCLKWLTL